MTLSPGQEIYKKKNKKKYKYWTNNISTDVANDVICDMAFCYLLFVLTWMDVLELIGHYESRTMLEWVFIMPNDQIMKESSLGINQVNQFEKCAWGTSIS